MRLKLYFISGLAFLLVVPLHAVEQPYYSGHATNEYRNQSPTFNNNGNGVMIANVTYGISRKQFKKLQNKQIKEIKKIINESNNYNNHQRNLLENQLRIAQNKLINFESTYQKENVHRQDADKALLNFKQQLPQAKINAARFSLSNGNTEAAGKIFDEIVRKGSGPIALAAFHSGQLAEDRIDYAKAMKQYSTAVALENNNTQYLFAAGKMAITTADYPQAQKWLEHLLTIRQAENKENIDLALAQHALARVYKSQGRYAKAEPLYLRALSIDEKALGKSHPNVAASLGNLAALYSSQGRYAKAEPLYLRSLEIGEKALGKSHPHVAASLNNLAALYESQGRYAKAEPLFLRALSIYEKALGKSHPHVAASLNNLAALYESQGRYAKAEPLYLRALSIYEKALGKSHPDVATGLNNLAGLYKFQGRYAKAEPLYLRSLEIGEKALGKSHPDVAISLNNLALLYTSQGRYAKAEPLYLRALSILRAAFPNGHPNTKIVQRNYERLKAKMRK